MSSENTCPRFHTAAQESNPGSLSRESKALPLNHCAIQYVWNNCNRARMFAVRMFVKNSNVYILDNIVTVPVTTFTYGVKPSLHTDDDMVERSSSTVKSRRFKWQAHAETMSYQA